MLRNEKWWYNYWKRKGHIPKKLTSNYQSIDSSLLYDNRSGALKNGEKLGYGYKILLFEDYIEIKPFLKKSEYIIQIVSTPCNYGGRRHWFLCPHQNCNKRVKKLYLHQGCFLCRNCLKLGYQSQRFSPGYRYINMKWKIINDLKKKGGDEFTRPKYMHKKTFEALQNKWLDYDNKATHYIMNNL